MELETLLPKDSEYDQINELYEECLHYLKTIKTDDLLMLCNEQEKPMVLKELNEIDKTYSDDPLYETIKPAENLSATNGVMNGNVTCNPIYEDKEDNVSVSDPIYESKVSKKVETRSKDEETRIDFRVDELTKSTRNKDENPNIGFVVENELKSTESLDSLPSELKSRRLRRLSQQLPKIVITKTQSTSSINKPQSKTQVASSKKPEIKTRRSSSIHKPDTRAQSTISINRPQVPKAKKPLKVFNIQRMPVVTSDGRKRPLNYDSNFRSTGFLRKGYGDFPKRLVSKSGMEHIALISNVPYEKIRLLNDTFHTLINLRWRWIVMGTIIVHFAMWLVFAVFWYITALSHYDFEPDPPKKPCITGGKDFVTIFLASVEAQTTIGFGDRAIDEECPESIFLFIMQLILGTGLSGVLTCVVYAKLTRPEKLSRDGVGFSKKAVISVRDGRLCLMMRAWDLNYDHIIGSEFCAHFINTHRTKEGETIRYHAATLPLSQKQFLLWPVTLVHEIDAASPLYRYSPEHLVNGSYEIAVSLKGASASMGTFTQSQTSYMPKEILWGYRFPPVVKYDHRKQKYTIDHKLLDATEPVDTPRCSASELDESRSREATPPPSPRPATPSSFGERMSGFTLERSSSFRKNGK